MHRKRIKSALISVFHKDGLNEIIPLLKEHDITVYSTGGTQKLLEENGISVERVEDLTGYPSILDGRVKTLHPKIFGGILAKREEDHQSQLNKYEIPEIDLVVVDLYPFEATVASTDDESTIIEKIDIGGISLIRAAAKNYKDVVIIPSKSQYSDLYRILSQQDAATDENERKQLALKAFSVSSHYDTAIYNYFNQDFEETNQLRLSHNHSQSLRYGENPHQEATFYGDLSSQFDKHGAKSLSYNNLVDIDSAVELIREFAGAPTTFAILKHTNSCGLATRASTLEAYEAALAGDPLSAFGGILITNGTIDIDTAQAIDKQFYEVLIAPSITTEAISLLTKKKNRAILIQKRDTPPQKKVKTILNGIIVQDNDLSVESEDQCKVVTQTSPTKDQIKQLLFANKVAKHLKSNTIVLVKNDQLIGMGCGQTSRIDACKQAIEKAHRLGFSTEGAVMASDAFFPFPDCVEIAQKAGIQAVIQPGGSKNDQLSIDFCDQHGLSMLMTNVRHFKH